RSARTPRPAELWIELAVELDGADGIVAEHDLGLRGGRDEERADSYGDCVPFHFSSSRKVFLYEEHSILKTEQLLTKLQVTFHSVKSMQGFRSLVRCRSAAICRTRRYRPYW